MFKVFHVEPWQSWFGRWPAKFWKRLGLEKNLIQMHRYLQKVLTGKAWSVKNIDLFPTCYNKSDKRIDFHINLIGRPEFKRKSKRATVIVVSTASIKQETAKTMRKVSYQQNLNMKYRCSSAFYQIYNGIL